LKEESFHTNYFEHFQKSVKMIKRDKNASFEIKKLPMRN